QRFGDVLHLSGFLGQAQQQVMVLGALKFRVLPGAGGVQQLPGEEGQVGDIVVAPQVIGGEIRLEVVTAQPLEVGRQDDLVGIDKVRPGGQHTLHALVQGVGVEQVVVVQQRDAVPFRQGETGGGVAGDAAVFHLPI